MDTPEAAGPDGAASIADGVERRLDPRALSWRRTSGWITSAGLAVPLLGATMGVGLSASSAALPLALVMAALLLALLGWSAQVWPLIEYRHASYRVDPLGIEIRRGVLWRRIINIGRSRVQHTDVAQGPLERRFGLATLRIHTAGTDHAKVDLPGLPHAIALRIRDHLLPGEADDAV